MAAQRLRKDSLFDLQAHLQTEVRDVLVAVLEVVDKENERARGGTRVEVVDGDPASGRLLLHVGVLRVFFRAACGLDREVAFVEFGHFEPREDGTPREVPDGEWRIATTVSEFAWGLRQPGGHRHVTEAIDRILRSLEDRGGDALRIVDGIVIPGEAEAEPPEDSDDR